MSWGQTIPQVRDTPILSGAASNRTPVRCLGRWSLAGIACVLFLLSQPARPADTPLSFGVTPYLPPRVLMDHFSPLRDHLQQAAGQQLSIETAPDYLAFRNRTRAGDYDIILTSPILGRLAEMENRYQRVAVTRYRVRGVILVAKDSPAQQLSDLRGKVVAVPSRGAAVPILAAETFRVKGLLPGRDITLREFGNNQNAMSAPLRGDSDASVTGFLIWRNSSQRDRLRVLAETPDIPGLLLMAHPRVAAATVERLRKAAHTFGDIPAGRAYFAVTGHEAWLPIDDATMLALDPYARYAKD